MSNRTRICGPIGSVTTGTSDRLKNGENYWVSIDVKDASQGWTLFTNNGNIKAVTTDANGMTVEQNAANQGVRWNASTMTSDRYYKKLIGPYGEVTWADNFRIEFLCELVSVNANPSLADKSGIQYGIADADVETGLSAVNFAGGGMYYWTTNPGCYHYAGGDTVLGGNSATTCVKGYCALGMNADATDADGNTRIVRVSGYLLDSNDRIISHQAPGDQTFEYTGTDPVYLWMSPTFGSNVAGIADPSVTFKLWYRLTVSKDNLSPTYHPLSGVSKP